MCGIAGICNFNREEIVSSEALRIMIKAIKHRGPDDEGFYTNEGIGLGHCRLSIVDLSALGHQPMSNNKGNIWIVYNGEIYNYKELMLELKSRGYVFRSSSDTEVIIHAYEEWGIDCVKRFNGMWAFAIWDCRKKQLFLSRDRFGVKPLYYLIDDDRVVFASELKVFMALPGFKGSPNEEVIKHFIDTGILDYDEQTFFSNIKSVLPAHNLIFEQGRATPVKQKYWSLDNKCEQTHKTLADSADEFKALLSSAVELRLIADVEVGSCLSGGLDSSSIVCLASKQYGRRLKTYSSVYKEPGYDEGQYVRSVVNECSTDSHVITPEPEALEAQISDIVWYNDGPSTDPSIFSQWSVMKLAGGNIKILLDGQGGDELLAGYHKYFPDYLNTLFKLGVKGHLGYLKKYFDGFKKMYPSVKAFKNILYCLSTLNSAKDDIYNDLSMALLKDITSTRLPWLLHYEDRCSMAFSIESRTPFLDYRLVEFAMSLPFYQKIDGFKTKIVLREALKGIVLQKVLLRTDKKGFPTPAAGWFREQLKTLLGSVINSESFASRPVFDPEAIKKRCKEHVENRIDHTDYLWRCLTTELWYRQFVDGKKKIKREAVVL